MSDHDSTRRAEPAKGGSHARDLRVAGGASAGLVSAILVGGALLAPIVDRNGPAIRQERGQVFTVQLAPPSAAEPGRGRDDAGET
nr:hypothetical protein [Solirubrobacterales bacterium]